MRRAAPAGAQHLGEGGGARGARAAAPARPDEEAGEGVARVGVQRGEGGGERGAGCGRPLVDVDEGEQSL